MPSQGGGQAPSQSQGQQPGQEAEAQHQPEFIRKGYHGADKLKGKVSLITGGDSGIGRAVAVHYAREGADVAIVYLPAEGKDADETKRLVEAEGGRCLCIPGDVCSAEFCGEAVERVVGELGRLDVLVNNAGTQQVEHSLLDISQQQLEKVFATNVCALFYMSKAALKHLRPGSSIINTTSINAYKGNSSLISYTSTKGAIVAFTRSLALQVVEQGIRVNAVAPGPIWTPLVSSTLPKETVATFGKAAPMGRAGQPSEVAPSYVFLASEDASFFAGQVLHPNGGIVVNG